MENKCLDLFSIQKQFLCCTPLAKFNFGALNTDNYVMNAETQTEIFNRTVNSDIVKQYPMKKSYQLAFLKLLINKIENSGQEVNDDLYETYCSLVSSQEKEVMHYKHFLTENNQDSHCITVQESVNIISNGTTGLCSWQATCGLIEWCNHNTNKLYGKTILELGSGVGLAGLNIIKTCNVKQYVFSDCHSSVLNLLCKNIDLNLSQTDFILEETERFKRLKLQKTYKNTIVQVLDLNWGRMNDYIEENWPLPDIVIGADILYETESFHALRNGLKALLSRNNSCAIIAVTVRNEDTFNQFIEQLEYYDLTFEAFTMTRPNYILQTTDVPVKILKISYIK
ncbi:protein-lysine N-methyltransferase EEF2KMT [Prorops nasuta]|uniref:protein-lysine N-methyltransferase EEF2KMT n=1 Tax=Prorops nasuta TaxID=863751 RepID=UPI0034CFB6AD